ncbi:MAG TPA: ThiF family adenylyltransferase [Candidatus Paceibacterota bacterium]|nr:ThiF family adenylyltransferase [Candidatus Paceibacterota bacterium]
MEKATDALNFSYRDAFARNRGLIPDAHQDVLRTTHVAIAGLGGVGGIYATTLARLGVGAFTIADSDAFEMANFNRQAGASMATLGEEKSRTIERMVRDINPHVRIRVFPAISSETVAAFLEGADVALDGIDFFNIEVRRLLFRAARERGIPVLTCAPIGFGASLLTFAPNSMSFDSYFALDDSLTRREQLLRFAIGISPSLVHRSYYKSDAIDFEKETAPSSVVATLACANLVATEVYKILTGLPYERAPVCRQFDPYVQKLRRTERHNGHLFQRAKRWYFSRILDHHI